MPAKYRVQILPEARYDLLEIMNYIAQDKPTAAEELSGKIIEALNSLSELPERGAVVSDLTSLTRIEIRRILVYSYYILYALASDSVVVYRVIHQSRDTELNRAILELVRHT